jgi:hypothetical protein
MKKTLLSFFLLFTITLSEAQIKKGAHFLGGSLGIYTEKTSSDTTADLVSNNFSFTPAYGRAIKDNLIFGGDLMVQTGKYESIQTKEDRQAYGAGIFLRKYMNLGKKFYLFAEGRFGGYYEKMDAVSSYYTDGNFDRKGFTFQAGLYPGVAFTVTNKLHIETGFNNLLYAQYSKTKTDYTNNTHDSETNRFTIGSSLSGFNGFVVGFRFILG